MSNNKKKVYVITIMQDGVKLYFESEECGLLDPTTKATIREARGYFSPDLKDAQKYLDKWRAEMVASAYAGSTIETIKDVERLK